MKEYYKAYDERYKAIHSRGESWASMTPTPIVLETLEKYGINKSSKILEIGCGEGRDALCVLERGFDLLATDVSPEAIRWCKSHAPRYRDRFQTLDCVNGASDRKFDFIYAVAVLHMLTDDRDRKRFYSFICDHLYINGKALVCSMGDGSMNYCSGAETAFEVVPRMHGGKSVDVAATTCRIVDREVFVSEIKESGLIIKETGITSSYPEFDKLIYAVVGKEK